MKLLLCSFLLLAFSCSFADAQSITGESEIDVDASSSTVTATCETDTDADSYEYYSAMVGCTVTDGSGTVVAESSNVDSGGYEGFAQVVLSFQGVAGTNYKVISNHSANPIVDDEDDSDYPVGAGPAPLAEYFDPYNFTSFAEGAPTNDPFPGSYDFFGPGPEREVHPKAIHIGSTFNNTAIPPLIIFKFAGTKTAGDTLAFSNAAVCSENLGVETCPDRWYNAFEGSALVNDDASKWTVNQQIASGTLNYSVANGSGGFDNLQGGVPFQPDGPLSDYLQKNSGSLKIFYIDAPAMTRNARNASGVSQPVNSLQFKVNFIVNICSTVVTSVCSTASFYIKTVVDPGGVLDVGASSSGLGTI